MPGPIEGPGSIKKKKKCADRSQSAHSHMETAASKHTMMSMLMKAHAVLIEAGERRRKQGGHCSLDETVELEG
jgi:hypothetical protein